MFHATRDTGDALGVCDPLTEAGVCTLLRASFPVNLIGHRCSAAWSDILVFLLGCFGISLTFKSID